MGETLRILLLEDVAADADLVEIELRQAGIRFTALRVETEPELRRALADFQPNLILADYALPSFNALEALHIVNQQSPEVPFILVTGSQSEEIAARMMKEGAQDYLLKSSLVRLPSAVRNALERKAAHRANLQADKALRESEERYRSLFEHMLDGYAYCQMLYDDQGHPVDFVYLDVNSAFTRLTGLENVVGKPVSEVIPGTRESHPELFQSYGRVASTGKPEEFEIDFQPLNKWLSISVYSPARGYFVAVFDDITKRKRAEEALRTSQRRLEMALVGGGLGTYEQDLQTGEILVDARYLNMLGYAPGELDLTNMKQWEQLVHPEDLAQARSPHTEVEYRMRHKDGHWIWVLDTGRVVEHDSLGQPLRMSGVHQDITDRKRVEEELRESEALLQEVGEMARVGGWELDVETKQAVGTSEIHQIHEVPPEERLNMATALLSFDLPQRSNLETALNRCMETGQPFDLELPFTSAKGRHLWTRVIGRAVKVDDKVVRLKGATQDISDRKQAEELAAKARIDFLFAVSHELKTPLLVMGAAQEMIESLPEEQRLAHFRDYSDFWRRNMMRLRFIIENLVDSQRPDGMGIKLDKQPTNLMDLVREIARELESVASARSVQFHFQGESLPPASVDGHAFRRLVENLLTNAIKFSQLGGQVEIRLRVQDEIICLDVCDFGIGIDPQVKPFLFKPFYRSPEAIKAGVQGTGLGLYVARMIAEAHGGTISLESEPGKGTTVTVRLPMEEEPRDPMQDPIPGP